MIRCYWDMLDSQAIEPDLHSLQHANSEQYLQSVNIVPQEMFSYYAPRST